MRLHPEPQARFCFPSTSEKLCSYCSTFFFVVAMLLKIILIIIMIIIIEIFIQVKTFSVRKGTVINRGPVLKSIYVIDYESKLHIRLRVLLH